MRASSCPTRGAQGGYALARPAGGISAAEIIDALEGPVAITECSSVGGGCDLESFCRVGMAWQRINQSIRKALEDVTLADLQHAARAAAAAGSTRRTSRERRGAADGLHRTRNGNGFDTRSTTSSNASYRHGFVTDIEQDTVPPGLDEDVIRLISAQEGRARVPDRMAAQGVSALADDRGADLGARPLLRRSTIRHLLLLGAEDQRPTGRRASTKSIRSCSRPTTSSASRCTSARGSPASPSTPCSTAFPSRRRSRTSSQPPA